MRDLVGRPRWTLWVVGLSIALNLFLLGFLGAQAWRLHQPEGAAASAGDTLGPGFFRQLARDLPPADARLLLSALGARLPEMIGLRRDWQQAVERLRTDIAQVPYADDKVRADLAAVQAARQKLRPVTEDLLLTILPQMSDEGRRALSQTRVKPGR